MPRPETMTQTATILVIDDEPQIRKFLRISLASRATKCWRPALAPKAWPRQP